MVREALFISVDWGTSNCRLRLVERSSLRILTEMKTEVGIRQCYEGFQSQKDQDQESFFGQYLATQVRRLSGYGDKLTIVLSGMASANIGLKELEYAALPIRASGENLITEETALNTLSNRCLLISGVRASQDVMRGEEIQAVGLSEYLPVDGEAILLLPGTHSKHLSYSSGDFHAFSTFMTGELFEVLSQHTILVNSLEKTAWDDNSKGPFLDGVRAGVDGRLTRELFGIRAGAILSSTAPHLNYFYLSGLLIGDELRSIARDPRPVFLAASKPLDQLYLTALAEVIDDNQIHCIHPEAVEQALILAHAKILATHE
ncbi:MAG: 2-dehydro-3-deoxygalactonokinase [Bacteroidota bacterium]